MSALGPSREYEADHTPIPSLQEAVQQAVATRSLQPLQGREPGQEDVATLVPVAAEAAASGTVQDITFAYTLMKALSRRDYAHHGLDPCPVLQTVVWRDGVTPASALAMLQLFAAGHATPRPAFSTSCHEHLVPRIMDAVVRNEDEALLQAVWRARPDLANCLWKAGAAAVCRYRSLSSFRLLAATATANAQADEVRAPDDGAPNGDAFWQHMLFALAGCGCCDFILDVLLEPGLGAVAQYNAARDCHPCRTKRVHDGFIDVLTDLLDGTWMEEEEEVLKAPTDAATPPRPPASPGTPDTSSVAPSPALTSADWKPSAVSAFGLRVLHFIAMTPAVWRTEVLGGLVLTCVLRGHVHAATALLGLPGVFDMCGALAGLLASSQVLVKNSHQGRRWSHPLHVQAFGLALLSRVVATSSAPLDLADAMLQGLLDPFLNLTDAALSHLLRLDLDMQNGCTHGNRHSAVLRAAAACGRDVFAQEVYTASMTASPPVQQPGCDNAVRTLYPTFTAFMLAQRVSGITLALASVNLRGFTITPRILILLDEVPARLHPTGGRSSRRCTLLDDIIPDYTQPHRSCLHMDIATQRRLTNRAYDPAEDWLTLYLGDARLAQPPMPYTMF